MLKGDRVTLRPVREEDLPTLYEWRVALDTWAATTAEPAFGLTWDLYRQRARERMENPEVVELAADVDGVLVGRAGLFHFDTLARSCEVGLSFGPEHCGKGYGRETLRLLVDFAFRHRNVHRVHLSTLATNEQALRAYRAAGFVEEGRRRESAWDDGTFVDEILMSVLSTDPR